MSVSKKIALGSMMSALGVLFMCLGTIIPIATYVCPAFAAITLLPVLHECGKKYALCVYAVISLLCLMFAPDREAALLFLFLGYYPVLKPTLDTITHIVPRVASKLAIFNIAAGLTLVTAVYILGLQAILQEYLEMTPLLIAVYMVVCNVTMLLYDRLYGKLQLLYIYRLRRTLFHLN